MRTIDWSASKKKYIEKQNFQANNKDDKIIYDISNNMQKN